MTSGRRSEAVAINTDLYWQLGEHARLSYPNECCGILFGSVERSDKNRVAVVIPGDNLREDPGSHYGIDPMTLYRAEKTWAGRGYEVIGFYHSHPDCEAVLSEEDELKMVPEQIYLILSVDKTGCRGLRAWRKKDIETDAEELEVKRA